MKSGNRGWKGYQMKTNYEAVVASAVAYWMLGALWYGVLFGQRWMALEGIAMEQAKNMNPVLPYVVTQILNLLIASVLAQLRLWRNANTAMRGLATGAFLWGGIVGPIIFTTYMYEMRSKALFAINEFYSLVGLCLMGVILGSWTKAK
jgi:hypothetical protein